VIRPIFKEFLDNKPLYFDKIDHKRIHYAYGILKPHIKAPQTVHIIGTNGKGSTGRVMAHLAKDTLRVGHFSSPHIRSFNERLWIDGEDISDNGLELAHQKLYNILGKEISDSLSYFEYTTLLALVAFEKLDLIILEAGLGGEFDATNVVDKDLTVVTPIAIDHQAFLGDTIEEIASTKLRSIQKRALLAKQPYPEVYKIAKDIAEEKRATIYLTSKDIELNVDWSEYIVENALVAMEALDTLSINYNPKRLSDLELFGRFYKLADNIIIDVGHNPLASEAIYQALDKKVILIYNSLNDKDYREILEKLKPKIERVEIIKIPSQRALTIEKIERVLDLLDIRYSIFDGMVDSSRDYLVFGSFYVVEEFLNIYTIK